MTGNIHYFGAGGGPGPGLPDLSQLARARGALVTALGAAIDAAPGDPDCRHRAVVIFELNKACHALGLRVVPEPQVVARQYRRNGVIVAIVFALSLFIAGALGFVAGDLNRHIDAGPAPAPSANLKRLA